MFPIRAFSVPAASLISSFRTISFTQLISDERPRLSPPVNAFCQFVDEKYYEIETGDNPKERIKELKRIWESMSPNEQQPYKLMYQVKKVHYIEDLIEDQKILLAGATLKIEVDYMEEYEKKESAAIENGIYNPPPKKLTGYIIFLAEELELSHIDYNQSFSEAVEKWKKMNDDQKKPYDDEAELNNWLLKGGFLNMAGIGFEHHS